MKTALLTLLLGCVCMAHAQTSLMTFNIRYDNQEDGDNWWGNRKEDLVDLLDYYHPDFLGVQEALPNQTEFLAKNLKAYQYIGQNRDGANTHSEAVLLFYDSAKFQLLDKQYFWLSDTPEKVSIGWDAALTRIAVYGAFKNKITGDTLHVFANHFDHRGKVARINSAKLLLKQIHDKALTQKKVILMGDLNSLPSEETIQMLAREMKDSFEGTDYPVYGPVGTFNWFDPSKTLNERIDYIFTQHLKVLSYRCIDDRRRNNLYPSDHLPVLVKIAD